MAFSEYLKFNVILLGFICFLPLFSNSYTRVSWTVVVFSNLTKGLRLFYKVSKDLWSCLFKTNSQLLAKNSTPKIISTHFLHSSPWKNALFFYQQTVTRSILHWYLRKRGNNRLKVTKYLFIGIFFCLFHIIIVA